MADAFERMHARLMSSKHFGHEALLRGLPVVADVDHGIALLGEYGEVVGRRSIADFPSAAEPKQGDAFVFKSKNYVIDSIEQDDSYTVRCVLRLA